MIVDPAPGALVRDPATQTALAPGADVDEHQPYWGRLLADGDLAPSEPEAEPAPVVEADATPTPDAPARPELLQVEVHG